MSENTCVFPSWAQFLWAGGAHGLGFTWAHPWALTRLLGPVTSLGSSLNARHSPWPSGQQGKAPGPWPGWNQLEKVGEGWRRPLGLDRPGFAGKTLWHTQNTLAHSLTGTLLANPWKCYFGHFGHFLALYIFWHIFHQKCAHFAH